MFLIHTYNKAQQSDVFTLSPFLQKAQKGRQHFHAAVRYRYTA
jgi:hypothetical protein